MKSLQIKWLKTSGIPFWVNALGHPIVARTAIEGRKTEPKMTPEVKPKWVPRVLQKAT